MYGFGYIIIRSPYTPYSIYSRGTIYRAPTWIFKFAAGIIGILGGMPRALTSTLPKMCVSALLLGLNVEESAKKTLILIPLDVPKRPKGP